MFILAQKMLGYWTMHFLCFYIFYVFVFLRFLGLFSFYVFKKIHQFFSLEFLVKNDLSYLSGMRFRQY